MAEEIPRPIDLLNQSRNKRIMIDLKNRTRFVGKLLAFDMHINTVLDEAERYEDGEVKEKLGKIFIRGDTIISLSPQ